MSIDLAPTMPPAQTSAPSLLAVTPLSPTELQAVATELSRRPAEWIDKVRLAIDERWYERLILTPDHEVWLISWLPGQSTGFHDHGGSNGAFTVALGELEELSLGRPDGELRSRRLSSGAARAFGPKFLHDVRNTSAGPAVTIHAYSPPLNQMSRYALCGDGLRRIAVEGSEQW